MAFGLSSTGFLKKRLSDLKTSLAARYKEQFGNSFITSDDTPAGKIIGIDSDEYSLLWEGLQGIWDNQDVGSATGVSQDRLYALNGLTRLASSPSTVTIYLGGTPGTIITTGATVSIENTNTLFQATGDITLGAIGTLTVSSITRASTTATVTTASPHGLITGDVVFIRGADQTDYNILASIIVTGASNFTYQVDNAPTTPATGTITAIVATAGAFEAVIDGPTVGLATTINTIETVITNWDFAENLNDANLGQNDETDAEFRTRRETSLAILGSATFEAIRTALINTVGVTGVTLLENDTGLIDVNGLPPYSFRALVVGGADLAIATTIFDEKGAGVRTDGTVNIVVVDSQSENHTINFSRLTDVPVNITVTIVKNTDPNEGPVYDETNGDGNIKTALVLFFDGLSSGNDVVNSYMVAAVGTVDGMTSFSVQSERQDAPGLTSSNLVITSTELASVDSSDITITP